LTASWLGFLLENIMLVVFIFVLFGTFVYVATKSANKWYAISKEKWSQFDTCEKLKISDLKRNYTHYFWYNGWRFIVVSLGFFLIYMLSLFYYDESGYMWFVLIFVLYLVFVRYAIKWYIEFPQKAGDALKEHEDAIINAVCKEVAEHADMINEFLAKYSLDITDDYNSKEECLKNMIKHPTAVKKVNYPPFIKMADPKKPIVSERKIQFIVLERDFMLVCLGATIFNLLQPKRLIPKKMCAYDRKAGPCKDIFYSTIKHVTYEDDGIKIFFWDKTEEPIVMKVKKPEDAKPDILRIRNRIRLVERQRLHKITEVLHFEHLRNDAAKIEVVNKEPHKIEVVEEDKSNTQEETAKTTETTETQNTVSDKKED